MKLLWTFCGAMLGLATAGFAQDIKLPEDPTGGYDPTLSAKEALMANWELAASGIRAGSFVARDVLASDPEEIAYEDLLHKARFTLDLMIKRYNSANWAIATQAEIEPIDGSVLLVLAQAAETPCKGDCAAQRADLLAALRAAADQMGVAHGFAMQAVLARKETRDSQLMVEQLGAMAQYLDSDSWYTGFDLADMGRERAELQARLVGALVLWRNVEAYVGLTSPQIDAAVNAASETMLRDMRRIVRGAAPLDVSTPEFARLTQSAQALAAELRRAAGLFGA